MTDDFLERLRHQTHGSDWDLRQQAADEIERLREENGRLREVNNKFERLRHQLEDEHRSVNCLEEHVARLHKQRDYYIQQIKQIKDEWGI